MTEVTPGPDEDGRRRLDPGIIEPAAVDMVPAAMAVQFGVVPIKVKDDLLTIAVAEPLDVAAQELLSFTSGCALEPVLCDGREIQAAISRVYSSRAALDKEVAPAGHGAPPVEYLESMIERDPESVDVEDGYIVDLVDNLISRAVDRRASDIHISPKMGDTRVRLRIDGVLSDLEKIPGDLHNAVVSRIKILAVLDIAERRRPQDGAIYIRYRAMDIDLRVAVAPTIHGESVTLRVLHQSKAGVRLDELGFEAADLERTARAIEEPFGFVLSTGPTGSGKTTTMYAVLNRINTPEKKIVTIEDPVEYRLGEIDQMQVNPGIGLSFAPLLRSVLRQDPNVILVGEIRDGETAGTAVQAALTGHLLLSTLHTTDAPEVLLRLMEIGVEYYYVREVVKLIIAQRLVRRLCVECRVERLPSAAEAAEMGLSHAAGVTVFSPGGCDLCGGTGYRDRTGVFEVMPMTEEVKDLMAPGVRLNAIRDKAVEQGMRTLWQNAVSKVLAGETSLEEIRRTIPRWSGSDA